MKMKMKMKMKMRVLSCVGLLLSGAGQAHALSTLMAPPDADFNHDGFVTGDDYDAFVHAFELGSDTADINSDGFVNGNDFDLFVSLFEGQRGPYVDAEGWTVVPDWPGCRILRLPTNWTTAQANSAVDRLGVDLDKVLFPRGTKGTVYLRIKHGGADPAHPVVIGSYGNLSSPLPILNFDSSKNAGIECSGGGGTAASVSNVYIMYAAVIPLPRDGKEANEAIRIVLQGSNWEFCGLYVNGAKDNFNVISNNSKNEARFSNFRWRRCVSINAFSASGAHAQGLYAEGIDDFLVTECLFAHNGWAEGVAGAEPTIFNHNIYFRDNVRNGRFTGNIFAYSSSHGINYQFNGLIEDNFFEKCPVPIFCRTMNVTVRNNVIMGSGDIGADHPRGMGLLIGSRSDLGGLAGPCFVTHNIFSKKTAAGREAAVRCGSQEDGESCVVSFDQNAFYDWPSDVNNWLDRTPPLPPPGGKGDLFSISGTQEALGKVPHPAWPDPSRSMASYAKVVGVGTTSEDFLNAAANNHYGTWRKELSATALNKYMREGFDMK
jgi:hypothetical protein